jgi:hypothetical protein
MLQRTHYNAIAAALRSGKASNAVIYAVATALRGTNSNYNEQKFIAKAMKGPTQEQMRAKFKREYERRLDHRKQKSKSTTTIA